MTTLQYVKTKLGTVGFLFNRGTKNFTNEWERFAVRGKTVLDIGAQNADTATYFISRGATKVIAYEKEPFSVLAGMIAISKAKMGDRIKIHWRHVRSLNEIITKQKLSNAILKMDIEGGEYLVLEDTEPRLFHNAFKEVMMEYHHGYGRLENWLRNLGYTTEHTKPQIVKKDNMEVGMIYAWR